MVKSVSCLGYITDSQGLHQIQGKVDVVQKVPYSTKYYPCKEYLVFQ